MNRLLLTILLVSATIAAAGETFVAEVLRVSDGDTAACILTEGSSKGTKLKVRFGGIDAPEVAHGPVSGQPFGDESAKFVRDRIGGRIVRLEVVDVDRRYGRVVALVYQGDECVNVAVVEAGLAEAYREYLKKLPDEARRELTAAEAGAKRAKRGIWSLEDYERPSDFRRRSRHD